MRILLIEDEPMIGDAIAKRLEQEKYIVDICYDGEMGLDYALSAIYDVIILDIMLPKLNGIEVLKQARLAKITTPILLLSAKGEIEDKVIGLDNGADDYLAKPFKLDELLARIRALCRRRDLLTSNNLYTFNDLTLNPNSLTLYCNKNKLVLTLKESQILELLIMQANQYISKGSIIEKVWGFDSEAQDSHVEVYISFLRKKLKMLKSNTNIKTIRGIGYSLIRMD